MESYWPGIKLHIFNVVGITFIKKQAYNVPFPNVSHMNQNLTK